MTASDLPDDALDSLGSISFEDLDADGDLDLVATATSYPSLSQGVVVYDNDGSGRFQDVSDERLPSFVVANFGATLIDADGDGAKDLIAATPTRILLRAFSWATARVDSRTRLPGPSRG